MPLLVPMAILAPGRSVRHVSPQPLSGMRRGRFRRAAIAKGWRLRRWLPWIFWVVGVGLSSGGTLLGTASSETVLSASSLVERQEAWTTVLDRWLLNADASLPSGPAFCKPTTTIPNSS